MPSNNSIALVTYSRYVSVYELGTKGFVKSTIMDGKEKITMEDLVKMLSVEKKEDLRKYICNLEGDREGIIDIIESLQPDPWICLQKGRYERAFYNALQACTALGTMAKLGGGRIVCCLGGPATVGEGIVASLSKEEIMRAHYDIDEGTEKAKVFKEASETYSKLANKLIESSLTVDMFCFSTDQFGLAEMKDLVTKTGGIVVMHELFADQIFEHNFKNFFSLNDFGEMKVASGATLNMHVSNPLLIKGGLGPIHSLKNKSKMATKEGLGQGETNAWYLGGIDQNLSITFFLDLMQGKSAAPTGNSAYIQFATKYKHPTGPIFLRVTTIMRSFLEKSNHLQYLGGVDQETVIAVYSKMAARKSIETDSVPVIRWLDRTLINIMKKYSSYTKNDKNSFQICEDLYLLPQIFYYLRKGNLVRKFATMAADRENVANTLVMVQPSLTQYDLENVAPVGAVCDIESMKDDVILLMDSYFHIVIWRGGSIVDWINQGYHEQESYSNLREIMEAPDADLKLLIQERIFLPKIVKCDQGSGDERIIKSKLNPSGQMGNTTVEAGYFITDDKSLRVFMEHLVNAVVTND